MRLLALPLLALVLSACSQWGGQARPDLELSRVVFVERNSYCAATEHNLEFTAQSEYQPVLIEWVVADAKDVPALCGHATSKACAHVKDTGKGRVCTITTARQLNLAILGHEVRHCYEGAWHR